MKETHRILRFFARTSRNTDTFVLSKVVTGKERRNLVVNA